MEDRQEKAHLKFARHVALEYYGINGAAQSLVGYDDRNYLITSHNGTRYNLKISKPDADISKIKLTIGIINHLKASTFPLDLPLTIPSVSGQFYHELEDGRILRLQKWVQGRMLAEAHPRSQGLLESWGMCCGQLSKHLQSFDHPNTHHVYAWDPSQVLMTKQYRSSVKDEKKLHILDRLWADFETHLMPRINELRHSVNHNDAHELNLVIDHNYTSPQVTGVIDFGDAVYTATVNELAIACAYACMDMPDPLEAACVVVNGYHNVFPLEDNELALLYDLIAARLVISVTHSAYQKDIEPENAYLFVSEKPAWALLEKWVEIHPNFAQYTFRNACGLIPCPRMKQFNAWAKRSRDAMVSPVQFAGRCVAPIDLSVGSRDLGNASAFETLESFDKKIQDILATHKCSAGIGGYAEPRLFYTTGNYLEEGNDGPKWRTIHLGTDIWDKAGTPVYAFARGRVVSVRNNMAERNYGPTIIIKHDINEELQFFTLYGHLSKESLQIVKPGQNISKGQGIGFIGHKDENGQWPPHLHFQIILDMLDNTHDFPGVAFPNSQSTWLSICPPMPETLWPENLQKSRKMSYSSNETLIQKRQQLLGPNLSLSYDPPLHIVRGFMSHLFDFNGQKYLDTVNNVAHVGHEHPRVVSAGQKQMAVLNTNTRYLHEEILLYAEELTALFPDPLSVVYFVNSGSEANELALRMARTCTQRKDVIVLKSGYHGNTGTCINVSSYKFDGKGGEGPISQVHVTAMPDTFRGAYRDAQTAGTMYAKDVGIMIDRLNQSGQHPAAFLSESILSCGGQVVLPQGYLQNVYRMVRNAGGVVIADEVQTGFGRVGESFWAFELYDVVPDIVTLGKPMGNGHPIGAVVTTRAIADAFANGMEYFNTFGGNPVSCAIGREVLKVIREEGLQQKALDTGSYLLEKLHTLKSEYPVIGDVRGHGLFLGIELITNTQTLEPATEMTSYIVHRMKQKGILTSSDGPYENVLKIKPPMCFDRNDADHLIQTMKHVLNEDAVKYGMA